MLRFGGRTADGRRIIGMVLSRENLDRLRAGQPVLFDGASVGVDHVVVMIHVSGCPKEDLEALIRETIAQGGDVRPIEEVLEERGAVREAGGDPDAEPKH